MRGALSDHTRYHNIPMILETHMTEGYFYLWDLRMERSARPTGMGIIYCSDAHIVFPLLSRGDIHLGHTDYRIF